MIDSMSFKEAAGREAFRPLGDGDVDIARLLERVEYSGWYLLEQDILFKTESREGEGSNADIRKSMAYLKQQFNRTGKGAGV